MAKLTKLNIGDSVASGGGRVWKKLSDKAPEDFVGTWVLNETLTKYEGTTFYIPENYSAYGSIGKYTFLQRVGDPLVFSSADIRIIGLINDSSSYSLLIGNNTSATVSSVKAYTNLYYSGSTHVVSHDGYKNPNLFPIAEADGVQLRTIEFYETALNYPDIDKIKEWIKLNGTKIS